MKVTSMLVDKDTIQATGSVMAFWPSGDYSEYLPKGTPAQRIGRYWRHSGKALRNALDHYAAGTRGSAPNELPTHERR